MFDEKKKYKIVVLGNSDVGKTSLLTRYAQGSKPTKVLPTIGADF